MSLFTPAVPAKPTPCWFVVATSTWGVVTGSDNLQDEFDTLGYTTMDLSGVNFDNLPDPLLPLLVWEGSYKGRALGMSDFGDGSLEYEPYYTGTWRALTSEEAVALAAGIFTPGIEEVYNHGSFGKHIMGQLKSIIDAHGPITHENRSSAHKRILGSIRDWNHKWRPRQRKKAKTMCETCG